MQTLDALLRNSLWAAALTAEELESVVAACFEKSLPAGGHAIRCGEPANCWVGVIEGLLKMSVSLADGRVSTFTGVMAGGWAGEGTLLKTGTEAVWRYDGVAVRPTRVACMPRHCFDALVATSLPFNHFLLQHLNARLSLFVGLVEYDRLLGPDARVARCLASLFDRDLYPTQSANSMALQLSQDEIGLLAAVSRQRAHQALHALEREGLVRLQFGGVTVLDLAALRSYSGPQREMPVVARG